MQYVIVQCSTVQYSTFQYSTVHLYCVLYLYSYITIHFNYCFCIPTIVSILFYPLFSLLISLFYTALSPFIHLIHPSHLLRSHLPFLPLSFLFLCSFSHLPSSFLLRSNFDFLCTHIFASIL